MDTSSGSDSYDRTRGHRPRGREAQRRPGRDRGTAGGRGGADRAPDISVKIDTLANTLQDTSRNLTKVDRMLGQYRDHTDDQAEAMALLRENLEESISQLQTQRLSRSNGARSGSASASTLHTSDLEAGSGSEGPRFLPTSPLKNYTGAAARTRRSQSAGVRFQDASLKGKDIHSLHQSLRDLRCDQLRLSDDLDKEIFRRNRSDIDTRRAMESLTGHMTTSQRQDSVSSRVERRLQELEREMHGEERERRPEPRGAMSDELLEPLARRPVQSHERDEAVTARLLKAEKSKMELDLDRARRLLEQSEDSRESLVQQVEDMRGELLRMRQEKTELQRVRLETSHPAVRPHVNHTDREEGRDRADLEKEVAELQVQLCKASVLGEVVELKRALESKEKERVQLSSQVEELSTDLARREQQQLRMLEQLREMQSRGQAERRETEAILQESTRSRDELKTKALEAVRQWRAKCKRMQKQLEEAKAQAQFHTDKASQAAREKESSLAQLKALSQTLAFMYKSQTFVNQVAWFQIEVREALVEETQRQAAVQTKLREENQRLEERASTQARRCQRDRETQDELQAALKLMTAARGQLAQRLAEEESSRKELQKGSAELQAKLTATQQERAALGQQLQLEREVHQKEVDNMKAMMEDNKMKKDREVKDKLKLCSREHDEMAHLKADAAADKELCGVLRIKLDRMKDECDKLAAQLSTKDEAHALLNRKHQLLKHELDDKVRSAERRRASEVDEKLLRMEVEQETILTAMGEELDTACRSLARNGEDKLQAISQKPGLGKDPHHWLAETKTKLRWLREEVRERVTREQRLRKQHQQTRDQLKALRQSRDSENADLMQRLDRQEKLLHSLSTEKKELLERSRRNEDEMRSLQTP
ncbi:putative centrosomal protein of 128 kDa isoform 2 [Scophthalmus maximus]|uniref:Putative centrosomal protein of 128 kDa isoform 2 n=1 Tax=Scophthalmus maximus TaxID=52904 RepID=A0A2U9CSQ3_SCOMX|nr:putative centrosomal protein of 128 kDa isoform 2 [Scophthalmus maximus]